LQCCLDRSKETEVGLAQLRRLRWIGQSFDLHSGICLQYFHALSPRQLSMWMVITFMTLYPVPWLHSWLMPFSFSLMKHSLLYFCPWGK
jgi:hypothetical protein